MSVPQREFAFGTAAMFAGIGVEAALGEASTGPSGLAFPFPSDSQRLQPADKIFMICVQGVRNRHCRYGPDPGPGAERVGRDIVRNHRSRRKDRGFPNRERLARRADDRATGHDSRILPYYDLPVFPDAPGMGYDRRPQPDPGSVVYLDAIRILILEVNVVPDEDSAVYLDAPQPMQKWS